MPISKINTTSITDNSVTAGKIVAGAVDADIAAGSIDTAQIADDAVTTVKITDANITTAKITDANITTAKIADNAITSAKLDTNIAVDGTLGVTGISTFQKDVNIGATTPTNLISNSEFTTNTTGWAASGSSLAIVSNQLQLTPNSGVNGFANQPVSGLVVGRSYIASVDVTVDAGALSRLYIGTSANGNQTLGKNNLGVGTHSFTFIATATTHHFALVVGGGTGQVTRFDNAKLTEVSKLIFTAGTGNPFFTTTQPKF